MVIKIIQNTDKMEYEELRKKVLKYEVLMADKKFEEALELIKGDSECIDYLKKHYSSTLAGSTKNRLLEREIHQGLFKIYLEDIKNRLKTLEDLSDK